MDLLFFWFFNASFQLLINFKFVDYYSGTLRHHDKQDTVHMSSCNIVTQMMHVGPCKNVSTQGSLKCNYFFKLIKQIISMNVQVVITISISGVILAIRLLPPALLVPKRCSNRRIYKMVDKYHQCFITINKKELQILQQSAQTHKHKLKSSGPHNIFSEHIIALPCI